MVFEIISPANRFRELLDKLDFYTTYGVKEYYTYDPDPERNVERTARIQAEQRSERLAARLRELGVDPDTLS